MDLMGPNGCLTPAGLRAVADAPPGRAPVDLAAHLAGCARCQQRLLSAGRVAPAQAARRPPAPRRTALLLGVLLVAALLLLWTARLLLG